MKYFKTDVLAAMDYYPFGASLPDRQWYADSDSGLYNFGFGGRIKDDAISGGGNSYTAEYWQYDSRLGRRFNQDTKPNPSLSNYACFASNPIWYSDPDRDTIRISQSSRGFYKCTPKEDYNGTDEFVCPAVSSLNLMYNGTEARKELVVNLYNMEDFSTIYKSSSNKADGSDVHWNPNSTSSGLDEAGNLLRPTFIGLGHELENAWTFFQDDRQSFVPFVEQRSISLFKYR